MHKRLYYLDNLKTFALLLGVLFHTSIVYAPNIEYAIKSESLHYIFSIVALFIHIFRMPLFFFLSGFFSYMVLQRKGGRSFTFSRLERILAPMIVGILSFAPIQYYLIYNLSHDSISFLQYYPKFFSFDEFNFSHLWFLVYLFTYSFLLITNYKLQITRTLTSYSYFGLKEKLKIFFQSLEKKIPIPTILFFKAVLFCFAAILITNIFFNKDDSFLRIQPVSFFYYFAFFITGVISYKKNLLQNLYTSNVKNTFNRGTLLLLASFVSLFIVYLYFDEIDPYWMNFTYSFNKLLLRIWHLFLESILAWGLIIFLLVFFKQFIDGNRPSLDYLRNSGMSIYLIHHPISLILANFLLNFQIPTYLKFSVHTFLVYALSFFFYHFLIKKSFILKRVFGTK